MKTQLSIEYDQSMLTKSFVQLMPIAILSMIIPSINSMVDVVVASRFIGVEAVTAIGFYTPFISVLIGLSSILLGGTNILLGKALGKGNKTEADKLFTTDMTILILFLSFISILVLLNCNRISIFMGADGTINAQLIAYMKGIFFSYPAMYGITHISSFLELEQQHLRNSIGVFLMLVLNLILNIVFVTILKLGLFGLGISTSISCWIVFIILCQYYCTKKAELKFSLKNLDLCLLPVIIKIGFPGAITQIYLAIRGYLVNVMLMQTVGEIGIASLSAQSTLGAFEYGMSYGISVASRTLFSVFIGSKDSDSIKSVMKIAFKKILPVSFISSVIMASLCVPLTRIFFTDPTQEVYRLTMQLFLIFPYAMFLSGICQIFSVYYQCHSWLKITNLLSFFDGFAGMALSMLILIPFFGALGVWLSFIGNGVFALIVIFAFTLLKCRKFPSDLDHIMMLPSDFDIPAEHRMNLSFHNIEEVMMCAKKVIEFCKNENLPQKKSYFSALALEEMATNIMEKGFKDKKRHTCVVEVANSYDELILRIMDDGKDFNPLKRLEIMDKNDITKNIGIRLVRGISDSMEYTRVIGLNILTIHLKR